MHDAMAEYYIIERWWVSW